MKSMNIQHHDHSTGHHQSPIMIFLSVILYALSFIFEQVSTLTLEDTWTWTWRVLSLFSLILLIIINFPKAKEVIFKKRKNGKRSKSD